MNNDINTVINDITKELLMKDSINAYYQSIKNLLGQMQTPPQKADTLKNTCNTLLNKLYDSNQTTTSTYLEDSIKNIYNNFNNQYTELYKILEPFSMNTSFGIDMKTINNMIKETLKLPYIFELKINILMANKKLEDIQKELNTLQSNEKPNITQYLFFSKIPERYDTSSSINVPPNIPIVPQSMSSSKDKTSKLSYSDYVLKYRNTSFQEIPIEYYYSCIMDIRILSLCALSIMLIKIIEKVIKEIQKKNPGYGLF